MSSINKYPKIPPQTNPWKCCHLGLGPEDDNGVFFQRTSKAIWAELHFDPAFRASLATQHTGWDLRLGAEFSILSAAAFKFCLDINNASSCYSQCSL